MLKFTSQRTYSLTVGIILFALGFLGFAFRTSFDVPDAYLIGALILGFWGIIVGVHKGHPDKNL